MEIFTSHLHSVHDVMTEVDGCLPPDAAFLGRFPQAFDATSVSAGVHAPGMTDLMIHDAYRWLRAQVLVPFHVCDAGGDPAFEITSLGRRLNLRLNRCIKTTDLAWHMPDGDGQSNPSHPCPLVRPRSRGKA